MFHPTVDSQQVVFSGLEKLDSPSVLARYVVPPEFYFMIAFLQHTTLMVSRREDLRGFKIRRADLGGEKNIRECTAFSRYMTTLTPIDIIPAIRKSKLILCRISGNVLQHLEAHILSYYQCHKNADPTTEKGIPISNIV
jgi:hypothetical protein